MEASWRQRAINAEEALKDAYKVIDAHRDQIGRLLGQIRDLEGHNDEETVLRIMIGNRELKSRIRGLTADNRTLEDKLKAARSNNRFLDKRVADLEAELLDAGSTG